MGQQRGADYDLAYHGGYSSGRNAAIVSRWPPVPAYDQRPVYFTGSPTSRTSPTAKDVMG
jgi:hypothetical protein